MIKDIEYKDNKLIIHDIEYFNPDDIFDCGQTFRFFKDENGRWNGVACGQKISVYIEQGKAIIEPVADAVQAERLTEYFDLERDYRAIAHKLSEHDPIMAKAAENHRGIRILRQDPFEALISFIISQNNNIPRISKIVNTLCIEYGERKFDENGQVTYLFPHSKAIFDGGIGKLDTIRAGFRAKYIYAAAKAVADGRLDLERLRTVPTPQLIESLCELYGVGIKIASCVALFAYGRFDSFPIDVWMKRVMEQYYSGVSYMDVFGENAGLAQQYLFCYIRDISK